MVIELFQNSTRESIRRYIEGAIETAELYCQDWQEALNNEPRTKDEDGNIAFVDNDRACVLERNAQQVGEISDTLTKILSNLDDLFHGSTQFISVDAEIREAQQRHDAQNDDFGARLAAEMKSIKGKSLRAAEQAINEQSNEMRRADERARAMQIADNRAIASGRVLTKSEPWPPGQVIEGNVLDETKSIGQLVDQPQEVDALKGGLTDEENSNDRLRVEA